MSQICCFCWRTSHSSILVIQRNLALHETGFSWKTCVSRSLFWHYSSTNPRDANNRFPSVLGRGGRRSEVTGRKKLMPCKLLGWMLKLKLQYFGHLMRRANSLEKTLMLGGTVAGGEGDDRGWDGWIASPTRWTWVWLDSGSWWWTGRPGVLWFMGSQRVGHDWVTELNWTDWWGIIVDLFSFIWDQDKLSFSI